MSYFCTVCGDKIPPHGYRSITYYDASGNIESMEFAHRACLVESKAGGRS